MSRCNLTSGTASVLEGYLPWSRYRNHGERVVQGQRLMQATSDIYLGWTKGHDVNRHFYWCQLRDMKGSALVEAMTGFSERCSDQNERDYQNFVTAVRSGRLEAVAGV